MTRFFFFNHVSWILCFRSHIRSAKKNNQHTHWYNELSCESRSNLCHRSDRYLVTINFRYWNWLLTDNTLIDGIGLKGSGFRWSISWIIPNRIILNGRTRILMWRKGYNPNDIKRRHSNCYIHFRVSYQFITSCPVVWH